MNNKVFSFNFKTGKLEPIAAAGLLAVGQVVTYSDMANPMREYVVTAAGFGEYGHGQKCMCEDGHTSEVSQSQIDGPGGWHLSRRRGILTADEIAAFCAEAGTRKVREDAERATQAIVDAKAKEDTRERLLREWPTLERAAGSKKSGHALGAANLRRVLARQWPTVKFAIRSKSYSGGNSIDVSWTDGPTSSSVDKVADWFQECDFDGMDDSTHYRNSVFPELFGGAKYCNASRDVSQAMREGLAKELGISLTFDKWGRAEGFKDWEQEQWFNRTLHARDFLTEPLTLKSEPEPVAVVSEPAQAIPEPYCPVLCW